MTPSPPNSASEDYVDRRIGDLREKIELEIRILKERVKGNQDAMDKAEKMLEVRLCDIGAV